MSRRERITLVGVILDELANSENEPGEVRVTRLAMRCNLPYDRFHHIFTHLQAKGLIDGPPYALTAAGRDLLQKYRGLNQALEGLGMSSTPREDPSGTHER